MISIKLYDKKLKIYGLRMLFSSLSQQRDRKNKLILSTPLNEIELMIEK